ncbi:endopeptidase La [Christensenellaceae bacterium OttesenSCG-928-M15]|nr:endopeptidase La [Christensenellaceae bacterium OttesenSCG-928-M15]
MFQTIPVIPLRGMVVFPGEVVHCDAGRKKTLSAVQAAAASDGIAFFCSQKDAQREDPAPEDLYTVGTICRVKQVFRIQGDGIHMLVTGISRGYAKKYTTENPYLEANVFDMAEVDGDPAVVEALRRRVHEAFSECAKLNGKLSASQRKATEEILDGAEFAYAVAALFVQDVDKRQALLEESHLEKRLMMLLEILERELQILKIDADIQKKLREEIEKNQKEHYLRERIKVIKKELGDEGEQEMDEFIKRMEEKDLPASVRERLEKEIKRFSSLPSGSHEAPMARAFIECILDLPWTEETKDDLNLGRARRILNKNHYGMEKVKERIVEYLAVQKLTGKPSGQIICLVGPPGVGKTSIVSSIAESMGRKFVRMSLGGVRDEAEIRGHRRTYIGAMPGRVISAMRQAGSINPVLLFDEIDKLASDFRGDPASAMLEVLDSAQNFAFKDHFLEIPYDLSHAMLLTTANDMSTIPRPLLDRMEVIHVESYLVEEKVQIAKRHLLQKQLLKHGLVKGNLRMTDGQFAALIHGYTREAGVRELERTIGALCRKTAIEVVEGKRRVTMSTEKMEEYLGKPRYRSDAMRDKAEVGVVTGLAWTSVGGETLSIEAATVPGSGAVKLTGKLGEVMQESGQAALTYVRAHAADWEIDPEKFKELDIHLHVPQGAVPKDGPSAGVAMTVAMMSAFSGVPVRADIAMTGEVTLRGRVLPIGGVREKALAALRAGITNIILPLENEKDVEEIPDSARGAMSFLFVEDVQEVLKEALCLNGDDAQLLKTEGAFVPTEEIAPAGYHA